MAEDDEQSSKTEDATPRRLEEARKRGDVAKSSDFSSWASFAGTAGVLAIGGGWMARDLAMRLLPFFEHPDAFVLQNGGAQGVMRLSIQAGLPAVALVLGAGMICGVAGNVVQHGFLWSPDKLKPDPSKLSPMAGFKRLYGVDGLVQFLKSMLKVGIMGIVAWMVMKPHSTEMQGLARLDPAAILPFLGSILKALILAVVTVLGLGAGADWLWQRQRFLFRMRMTREELKEDVRQSEGDPLVKAKIRQMRNERARRRMMQNVPKATLVVVNPTHYAVALRYVAGETAAPQCLAKGVDRVALRIRELAEEHGVPVVEDPPLARALYAAVEIDEAIPVQHYEAVAKVIGFVMNAARRRMMRAPVSPRP